MNALVDIDSTYLTKEFNSIQEIKRKIDSSSKDFEILLKEKLNRDGSVNRNKLDKKEQKLFDTCIEMESLLWKQVLNTMKKTINKYKLLDGGQAEEIFSDFLYDEYAMLMAKNANTKIADQLFLKLSGYQK
ncbi:MAG TPA: rod-binding protein [Spirochaetota bacterium]|nr:rod-binding protein [Spirochaetota bacterium]HOL56338.1 rod-binding protein [Spirochaetota bacterium]HPP03545.1 rod-binding protein [Spirochaetota bacterium]